MTTWPPTWTTMIRTIPGDEKQVTVRYKPTLDRIWLEKDETEVQVRLDSPDTVFLSFRNAGILGVSNTTFEEFAKVIKENFFTDKEDTLKFFLRERLLVHMRNMPKPTIGEINWPGLVEDLEELLK